MGLSVWMCVQDKEVRLEGLELSFTRESAKDPPQTYIMTLRDDATQVTERQVTNYPHPHPSVSGVAALRPP